MLVFKHLLEHITINCKHCAIQLHVPEVNIWYRAKYARLVFVVQPVIIKFDMRKEKLISAIFCQPVFYTLTHSPLSSSCSEVLARSVVGGRFCQYHKLLCAFQMSNGLYWFKLTFCMGIYSTLTWNPFSLMMHASHFPPHQPLACTW